jgi:hypothetical protein
MDFDLYQAIGDEWAWGSTQGRSMAIGIRRVPRRCFGVVPGQSGHGRYAGKFGIHRPCLMGCRHIACRPLLVRVRQRHVSQTTLMHRRAPSGFVMRQFPCATYWLSCEGSMGFSTNHDGRLAMSDGKCDVSIRKET